MKKDYTVLLIQLDRNLASDVIQQTYKEEYACRIYSKRRRAGPPYNKEIVNKEHCLGKRESSASLTGNTNITYSPKDLVARTSANSETCLE